MRKGFQYLDFANRTEVKCYRCGKRKPRVEMTAVRSGGKTKYHKCEDRTKCVKSC